MRISNKVFILIMACLLALGALCLAFGIMLGGSLNAVANALWQVYAAMFGITQ